MSDGGHFGRVHVEALAQTKVGSLCHDHDLIRQRHYIVQDRPLMRGRMGQDGMGNDDGRYAESAQDFEHLVTIVATVEAILVLNQRNFTLVQCLRAGQYGGW